MWLFSIIGLLILFIIAYLLFAPFFLEIDSTTGLCRVRLHRLASAQLVLHDRSLFMKLKVAWWQKELDLLAPRKEKSPSTEAVIRTEKKKKQFQINKMLRKMKSVLKSFRIDKCYLTFDTGNMPLNGILYPSLYLLSQRTNKTVMINFWEENEIILQIENSVARMLWAYIRS